MAGDWMKIELELPDKPEVHSIAAILNIDPDAVVGKLIRVWQWFDKHTTDGNAFGVTYSLPDRISGVSGFAEAMVFVGWLEQNDKILTMPKFDRHTSNSAKTRALTQKRVSKTRNAVTVTEALPEKRREEKRETKPLSAKPDVITILEYLNSKAGRSYKPVEANSKFILSRLNEGATVDDMKRVIDAKVSEWLNDATMNKYLRPATLFNAEKFAQYSGETSKNLSAGKFNINDFVKAHQ